MNRVVVGVTDSPASRQALRWAFNSARAQNLALEVLTVYPINDAAGSPGEVNIAQAAALAEQGRVVDEEIGLDRFNNPVYCDAVAGDPVKVLCERADGATMLVVGRRSSGLQRRLASSVSEACVNQAPCAVVVVRADLTVLAEAAPPSA